MKTNKTGRIYKILLVGVLSILLVGCGFGEGSNTSSSEPSTEGKNIDEITLGFNNYGRGAYSLDILEKSFTDTSEAYDIETMIVNDERSLETVTENLDSMIGSGVDGVVFFGADESLFPIISQKTEAAGVHFVTFDHMPSEENIELLKQNPYYAGSVGTGDVEVGRGIAEEAVSIEGLDKALIVTGAITDPSHTSRVEGFTQVFEEAGGEILDIGWEATANASDAITITNDLLSAYPDANTLYVSNGTAGSGVIEVLKQRNPEIEVFITDLDSDILEGLKDGLVTAANGAHWVNASFATALLSNAILDHKLSDDNGEAPEIIVPMINLPAEHTEYYEKYWVQSKPYSDEELQQLVFTWNEDITLEEFENVVSNYGFESRMLQKYEDGVISENELEELGIQ